MNHVLKYEIKSDVRDILAEIEYEEYMFNKIFKTHITFKNSYEKFNLIYNVYGPQAYRKFVPTSYQKQDLINLINTKNYLVLYDRHGKKVYNNLIFTVNLINFKKYYSKLRAFAYRFINIFSRKKLKIKGDIPLLLPETIPYIQNRNILKLTNI